MLEENVSGENASGQVSLAMAGFDLTVNGDGAIIVFSIKSPSVLFCTSINNQIQNQRGKRLPWLLSYLSTNIP